MARTSMKRLFDLVLTIMVALPLAGPILVIAALVRLTSSGPVIYWSSRVGRHNRPFLMPKFRSMRIDTPAVATHLLKTPDAWLTPIGSFLRKTSLDELPQFFNVLQGKMSIVGPRPERPVFVEQFKKEIPDYMKKHLVKAGITGWAQIHGWRGDTDLNARIEHDLYYIENWSLWLDLKIIFFTIFRGFVNKNAY